MTFSEMLKFRRSIRNYHDKPVALEIIKEMIAESTLAPSARNEQPWNFIIVNDKNLLKRMSDESKKNILALIAANPNDHRRKFQGALKNEFYNVFYNAPNLVLIIGQADLKNLYVDCALAASYFMMAAVSRYLGTCWINLGAEINDPEMRNELGIPDNYQIVAPLILGYPVKIPPVPERKEAVVFKIIT